VSDDGYKRQTHNHEYLGSVMLAGKGEQCHNHRFAGVSSSAIRVKGGHVHKLRTTTDHAEDHHHEICAVTGLQIPVGNDKHVHFVHDVTSFDFGHRHEFVVAVLIEAPTD
jgi:hypothetical protein